MRCGAADLKANRRTDAMVLRVIAATRMSQVKSSVLLVEPQNRVSAGRPARRPNEVGE